MLYAGLAGKGDQGMQNPSGQVDRPVSFHFLERSVQLNCDSITYLDMLKMKTLMITIYCSHH